MKPVAGVAILRCAMATRDSRHSSPSLMIDLRQSPHARSSIVDVDALLTEYLEPVRRQFDRDLLYQKHLHQTEMDVTSPDGTVKVTQTCAGEIRGVEFAPGAFGKHSEPSLAEVLVKTLKTAREIGRQAAGQMADKGMQEQESRRGS